MKNRDIIKALQEQYSIDAPDIWHKITHVEIPKIAPVRRTAKYLLPRFAAGFAALAAIVAAAWGEVMPTKLPVDQLSTTQSSTSVALNQEEKPLTKIVINESDENRFVNKIAYDCYVNEDDRVGMSKQELIEFYGFNVFPSAIPKDMKELVDDNDFYGSIYNNGKGEVYWSQNIICYTCNDYNYQRELHIELSKWKMPFSCVAFEKEMNSYINGNELYIGHYKQKYADGTQIDEYYSASFMYKNVGFEISATNMTKKEFISALSSILSEKDDTVNSQQVFTLTKYAANGEKLETVTVSKKEKVLIRADGSFSASGAERTDPKTGKKENFHMTDILLKLSDNVKKVEQISNPIGTAVLYECVRLKNGQLYTPDPEGGRTAASEFLREGNWINILTYDIIDEDKDENATIKGSDLITIVIRVTFEDDSWQNYTVNMRPTANDFLKFGLPFYDIEIQ